MIIVGNELRAVWHWLCQDVGDHIRTCICYMYQSTIQRSCMVCSQLCLTNWRLWTILIFHLDCYYNVILTVTRPRSTKCPCWMPNYMCSLLWFTNFKYNCNKMKQLAFSFFLYLDSDLHYWDVKIGQFNSCIKEKLSCFVLIAWYENS